MEDSERGGISGLVNHISGSKTCISETCYKTRYEGTGPIIEEFSTRKDGVALGSWRDCAVLCKRNPDCKRWTLWQGWQQPARCTLHSNNDGRENTENPWPTSGDNNCDLNLFGTSFAKNLFDWVQNGFCVGPSKNLQHCGIMPMPDYTLGDGKVACFTKCLKLKADEDTVTACQYKDPVKEHALFGECIFFTSEIVGGDEIDDERVSCLVMKEPEEIRRVIWPEISVMRRGDSGEDKSRGFYTVLYLDVAYGTDLRIRNIVLEGVTWTEKGKLDGYSDIKIFFTLEPEPWIVDGPRTPITSYTDFQDVEHCNDNMTFHIDVVHKYKYEYLVIFLSDDQITFDDFKIYGDVPGNYNME